jgi:hypothetical protein
MGFVVLVLLPADNSRGSIFSIRVCVYHTTFSSPFLSYPCCELSKHNNSPNAVWHSWGLSAILVGTDVDSFVHSQYVCVYTPHIFVNVSSWENILISVGFQHPTYTWFRIEILMFWCGIYTTFIGIDYPLKITFLQLESAPWLFLGAFSMYSHTISFSNNGTMFFVSVLFLYGIRTNRILLFKA